MNLKAKFLIQYTFYNIKSDIVKNIPELKGFLDLGVGSFMLRRIFKAS